MWWFATICVLALLNATASVVALRSGLYERPQLHMQLVFVWLVPLFGAALILLFTLSQGSRRRTQVDRDHSEWENVNAGQGHGPET